jgi:hypothetical protein
MHNRHEAGEGTLLIHWVRIHNLRVRVRVRVRVQAGVQVWRHASPLPTELALNAAFCVVRTVLVTFSTVNTATENAGKARDCSRRHPLSTSPSVWSVHRIQASFPSAPRRCTLISSPSSVVVKQQQGECKAHLPIPRHMDARDSYDRRFNVSMQAF